MSSDLVALAKQAFAEWNTGEREIERGRIHREFEVKPPSTSLTSIPVERGPDALLKSRAELSSVWDLWVLQPAEFIQVGERVLILGTVRARGAGSGVEVEQARGWLLEFEGDQIRRIRTFDDPEHARAAAEAGN